LACCSATSAMGTVRSSTRTFHRLSSESTESRVTPASSESSRGGVTTVSPKRKKAFIVPASSTFLWVWSSHRTWWKPRALARSAASIPAT